MSNELKAFCTSRKCADIRYENLSNYAVVDVTITAAEHFFGKKKDQGILSKTLFIREIDLEN